MDTYPKVQVGDVVKQGDVVGQMGRDANTGKGLIEIVFCESKDSKPCDKNGKNIQLVDPIQYLERPMSDISYLEKDMTTMLDTTGLGDTPVYPSIIWPWEDKNDPDIRYRENKDVNIDQAYLRKLIVEYGREIDKTITHKNIEKNGIITYDAKSGITTVKLNGRSKRYGVSLGNAQIKNNRMIVNREQVWYDLIGKTYHSPDGGTWYADKTSPIFGGVWQCVYLPKDIANDLYLITEGTHIEKVLYDKAAGAWDAGTAAALSGFCTWVYTEYGVTISVARASFLAGAIVCCYDLSKAWERDCFREAVMQCGDNEFVRISFIITDGGIVNTYRITKEIKDVYRYQGTFKPGYYESYSKVKK
ncbi:hypothetical protein [Aminipila terrae]|uniref:Uncharacterized protein n=1 Tax=Aminipila terrae TaxID=2697030 RepID=A0A6P1MFH0_9FIRM|nr:hypothetical protein [Aminipila terrae]QHI72491.1 hypothetical protein Ami3637_08870 [Aminipila terrae]